MKVLLLNQFFWPDAAATSQLLTDVARKLVSDGHEVDVICGTSGYALNTEDERPAVDMNCIRSVRFSRGKLGRLASYASFYLLAAWRAMRVTKPDVVVTLTTPPLLSLLGNLVKATRGARHVIWEMDVYPDVAVDLGYFEHGGWVQRIVGVLADASRRYADSIIALGECMRDRLIGRGVAAERIAVADNWADSIAIRLEKKELHEDELVVLYSGNLGLAHDLETIEGAMVELCGEEGFRFAFSGSGGRREELATFAKQHHLSAIEFRPYATRTDLSYQLAQCDIGLVTQSEACCGSVVPSKIYGLLAAGRPILFIGPERATPARIVRRFACGWHIACGDVFGLTQLLRHLRQNAPEVADAGARARRALVEHFDLAMGTERIASIICGQTMRANGVDRGRPETAALVMEAKPLLAKQD